uniref:CPXV017 protein n=1 Tax=Strongyloides venezuelensis TaxID=75913 RepID=A0A0K0G3K7_STRVS
MPVASSVLKYISRTFFYTFLTKSPFYYLDMSRIISKILQKIVNISEECSGSEEDTVRMIQTDDESEIFESDETMQ